ncbi:hypothetical protein O2N63_12160 [Aliiroseovarius sp. KMU-50]|uniref:Uncharacterized protein n=1 Tax=Aliiroseovarius salicola TaxID=3009082 RepID=A0ABT4W2V0_9RHOB|nr:hypothetical protein [Aliiroseovarius sp. KMU-50]MDA5094839.1 hypothetical protein [Aliiroseovarius sp. KMU-50]
MTPIRQHVVFAPYAPFRSGFDQFAGVNPIKTGLTDISEEMT